MRLDEINVKLFTHPFDLAVEYCPDDCQMELVELQADMGTNGGYSEDSFVNFYKLYVCWRFPNSPVMQEKGSPSMVAPTAVSNSLLNEAHQIQMSK